MHAVLTNRQDPLSTGLIVDLVTNGIELRFDARSQRLEIVRLYDLKRVELWYSGQTLSSAWAQPSVFQISKVFGPSIPGTYEQNQSLFKLSFPVSVTCSLLPNLELMGESGHLFHISDPRGAASVRRGEKRQ